MVDIIIGSIAPPGTQANKPGVGGAPVEAELLNIRESEHRTVDSGGQERHRQEPQNGRILTLLIPNDTILPKDLDGKKYKVLLRFMKK